MPRPSLPVRYANPLIQRHISSGSMPQVKYQVLECNGQEILVGRMKVETPTSSGHAFILRRFDTGAISLTTMFRAAFPTAPDDTEKAEVQWVRENHDLTGNNGSSRDPTITRLAGTWVDARLALELGTAYAIAELIDVVVKATPDPNANYRRSAKKEQENTTTPTKVPSKSNIPVPSPAAAGPGPAKKRRESSPAPTASQPAAEPSPIKPPSSRSKRSLRSTKSPTPLAVAPMTSLATRRSTRRTVAPGGSDETAVEEDAPKLEEVASQELHDQDIAEQKEMIREMKAERESRMALPASPSKPKSKVLSIVKRAREDEDDEKQLRFEFKEPEVGERAIVSNKRVGVWQNMEPERKSFAWGVAAFVFGAGAVSLLPNFF